MNIGASKISRVAPLTLTCLLICFLASRALAQTVALKGNHPTHISTLHPVGRPSPSELLDLRINFGFDRRAANELLAEQQQPSSPEFHHRLTPDEFTQRFGPTKADFDAVQQWLKSEGFRIYRGSRKEGCIWATATVAQAETAFHTTIASFNKGELYANLTDPSIPAKFKDIVVSIDGLENFTYAYPVNSGVPAPKALSHPDPSTDLSNGSLSSTAFAPNDFYTFYDEWPLLNSKIYGHTPGCIAVIGDSDYLPSAVSLFTRTFMPKELPPANIDTTLANGINPGTNADETEALLDLEWAHVAAPGASLEFYLGCDPRKSPACKKKGQGIVDAIRGAVSDEKHNCEIISISYAFCNANDNFFKVTLDPIFMKAAMNRQWVFVASGDYGAAGRVPNGDLTKCITASTRGVSEMSADPNVTSVGGTQFQPNFKGGNDVGFVPESVWNDKCAGPGCGATGGGVSSVFDKPSYQVGPGVPQDSHRDIPDVALIASRTRPGVVTVQDVKGVPGFQVVGGTSLATPLWAGIGALIVQKEGRVENPNNRIYQLGQLSAALPPVVTQVGTTYLGRRAVTTGDNTFNGVKGFFAEPWYNQSTGWGTVDIANFVGAFTNSKIPGTAGSLITFGPSLGEDHDDKIIAGPDGNIWFNFAYDGELGKINPHTLNITKVESNLPSTAGSLAVGIDGNIWVTGYTEVFRISPQGKLTSFPIPGEASDSQVWNSPEVTGPDGNIWFQNLDFTSGKYSFVRMSTSGKVAVFPIPPDLTVTTFGMVVGPDGNLWLAAMKDSSGGDYTGIIASLSTSGSIVSRIPIPHGIPSGVAIGPDGNVWFDAGEDVISDGDLIGIKDYVGVVKDGVAYEYLTSHQNDYMNGITCGPDGNIWAAQSAATNFEQVPLPGSGNYIESFSPQHPGKDIKFYTGHFEADSLIVGEDGNIWFTDSLNGKIGRIAF